MNRTICFALAGMALLSAAEAAHAADYYMSPKGAGAQTGGNWDDSFAFDSVNEVLNRRMKPGDTLHLEGAVYGRQEIVIDSSGAADAPKSIVGEDRGKGLPLFGPTDDQWMNWKDNGILFKAKSSHWIVKNLRFRLYSEPTVCTTGPHAGLRFDNLRVLGCYTGFLFVDCDDMVVRNCYATRFSQQGFCFANRCERVLVQNCEADGSPGKKVAGDVSQVGFQCGFPKAPAANANTHITFEDCVARNNLDKDRKQSWVQGDGFLAEPGDRHLRFRRCRSFDASDGCYDLKAQIDEFTDCVAVGPGRGFKFWYQTMTMTNCIGILTGPRGYRTTGAKCALEVNNRGGKGESLGGHITAQSCTFDVRGDGYAVYGETYKVTLNDCIAPELDIPAYL